MSSVFCGRQAELQILQEAWRTANSKENSHPQVVVLVGDRGIGKTRILQEFYSWLSNQFNVGGYWPDRLGQQIDNLRLHVEPAECRFDRPIPFLWWALRLADPGRDNAQVSSAVEANLRFLQPHLEAIEQKITQKKRWYAVARTVGEFGVELLGHFAFEFPIVGGAKAIFEVLRILKERQERKQLTIEELDRQKLNLVDGIIGDLSKLIDGSLGAGLPSCVVFDDVQFSRNDPTATDLFAQLIVEANRAYWPMLIVLTCWIEEWYLEADDENHQPLIAALRRHADGENVWWRAVKLGPIDDLRPMIQAALPGISKDQQEVLLTRAGGNPRFLGEIIRHLVDHPRYFTNRDVGGELTPAGLRDALERTLSLHSLVKYRLMRSPVVVQRAVALGSLQGMGFLAALTADIAQLIGAGELGDGVEEAVRPHAFVAVTEPGFAEFVQRIYHEVAHDHLADMMDPGTAKSALKVALRARLENQDRLASAERAERMRTWLLAAQVFETEQDVALRKFAAWAYSELARESLGDTAAELAFSRRFAELVLGGVEVARKYYSAPVSNLLYGDPDDEVEAGRLAWHAFHYHVAPYPDKFDGDSFEKAERYFDVLMRLARHNVRDPWPHHNFSASKPRDGLHPIRPFPGDR